jgi:hypothetical protein
MKAVNMSNDWRARARRPDEALELIKGGMRVFVHGAAATPAPLLEALARRRDVEDLRLFHCFVSGSRRLYDFVNDNPFIEFHPCDRTNDTAHIRRNDRVVAINSAIEIDISGQVCADSIGFRIYSGIGGRWISSEARAGQRVIIAGIADDEIVGLNIPTRIPLVCERDDDLKPIRSFCVGAPEAIANATSAVAGQLRQQA